jgi:hypothetical protein
MSGDFNLRRDRRELLALGLGVALGGAGVASASPSSTNAQTAQPTLEPPKPPQAGQIAQTASEHARAETLPPEAFRLPRFRPLKSGNYDLAKPLDNHLAFAKAQANLAGEFTWIAKYGWMLVAPPGRPAYPFLGRVTLMKVFVTPADPKTTPDVGPDDFMMWGTFTKVHVDPRNFRPVSRLLNPHTGKMMEAPTVHYADRLVYRVGRSILVPGVDPKFYDQPWDRDGGYSPHFIDDGDTISYTVLGSSQFEGPHQPRCDVGFWSVSRKELMDPAKRAIDARHDYSVIQKMTEYPWFGAEKGDPTQLFCHEAAIKTQDLARIPPLVKSAILEPHRARFL